ncbi:MAG TPA: FKBP-type peptidyl-prolyl cis-trans isomerase [Pirellulales bacterium]|nr:FKBP-type peptidyl-prolyl cis-trans isomerase [Pirellulales bacterium]
MRVLFAWALGLTLCAGWVFAAEPAAKKPKGDTRAESNDPADDGAAEPGEAERTGDEPESDGALPEESEGDETPAKNKKPAPRTATSAESEILKKASYNIGVDTVRMYQGMGIDLVLEEFIQGIKDELAGKAKEISDEEKKDLKLAMDQIMAERQAEMVKEAGAKFKREGEAFLAANKKKEGVKTTKSGLQYKVLKSGKGKSPKTTDTVTTHYKGTFIDGKEFDSSYKNNNNQPVSFPVNRVIPGWTEALQLMKVGDKWRLVVPAKLAYGPNGQQDPRTGRHVIPPNATLIFDVELLGVKAGSEDE